MEAINLMNVMPGSKTWEYTEIANKHVINHSITLTKDRFTHESKINEAAQEMRQRTDVSLKNVNSVNTYYGLTRNILATALCAVIAVFMFIASIPFLFDEDTMPVSIVFFVLCGIFAIIAYIIYKKTKPSFILEIETVINNGTLRTTALAYGNATVNLGPRKGIFALFRRNKSKYKFVMDPVVGNDIVDTIGPFLFDK